MEDKKSEKQFLEQNLSNMVFQKQALEMELAEINASLKELEKSGEEVYKIVGAMMLKSNKTEMKKNLEEKKSRVESNLSLLKDQEGSLKKSLENLNKK